MKSKKITFTVDSNIYPKDIIFATIDFLSGEHIFLIKRASHKEYHINVEPRFEQNINDQEIEAEFFDEMNNQVIREKILSKTKNLRELIVGKALFETKSFDDNHDYFDVKDYPKEENYLLDQQNIAEIFQPNERQ